MNLSQFLLSIVLCVTIPELMAQQTQYSGHGVESISAEVLAKYAPKPFPSDVTQRVQMIDVRTPGREIPSPDGPQLYFTWSVTGTLPV